MRTEKQVIYQERFLSLSYEVPIVEGTHPKELKSGVGHFAGSMLPGQGGANLVDNLHVDSCYDVW